VCSPEIKTELKPLHCVASCLHSHNKQQNSIQKHVLWTFKMCLTSFTLVRRLMEYQQQSLHTRIATPSCTAGLFSFTSLPATTVIQLEQWAGETVVRVLLWRLPCIHRNCNVERFAILSFKHLSLWSTLFTKITHHYDNSHSI